MMKKRICFVVLFCFPLILSACGNASPNQSASGADASDSEKFVSNLDKKALGQSEPVQEASDSGKDISGSNNDSDNAVFPCEDCGGTGKKELVLGCYGCNNGISFYTGDTCTQCDGTGNKIEEYQCLKCGGDGLVGNEEEQHSGTVLPDNGIGLDNNDFYNSPGITVSCPACGGSGEKICVSCNGSGSLSKTQNAPDFGFGSSSYQVEQKCRACSGSGRVPCTSCGGDGQL